MILRLLIAGALITALFIAYRKLKKQTGESARKLRKQLIIIVVIALFLILAVTGHLHWLTAIIAAAIPLLIKGGQLLLRSLPFLKPLYEHYLRRKQQGQQNHSSRNQGSQQQQQSAAQSTSAMSQSDAEKILGLQAGYNKDDITRAHKRLMQKLHPDRGGSDALAAQVNQAKDVLLKHLT